MARKLGLVSKVVRGSAGWSGAGLLSCLIWANVALAVVFPVSPFTAVTDQGRPLVGATVGVNDSMGVPATVWANSAGTQAFSGVVPASGVVQFYAAPGTYSVTVSGAGISRVYAITIPVSTSGLTDADFSTGVGLMRRLGVGSYGIVKVSFGQTTDPTVTDDVSLGYGFGSEWINTTTDNIFLCSDPTAGAAVWKNVGASSGVTSINAQTGPAVTITSDSTGSNFSVASAANVITIHAPSAGSSVRGLVSTGTQTFGGSKVFAGAVVADATLQVNSGFIATTITFPFAFYVDSPNDNVNFFIQDATALNTKVAMSNPSGSKTVLTVQNAGSGDGIDVQPGTGTKYGVTAHTTTGNTGAAIRGTSVAAGSKAATFFRGVGSGTVPVVDVQRSTSSDSSTLFSLEDTTATVSATYGLTYKLNGTIMNGLLTNGQIVGVADVTSTPAFTVQGDTNTGFGVFGGLPCLVDEGTTGLCQNGASIQTVSLIVTGEIQATGVTGTGKAVCVKSDSNFGVCSDQPNGSGVCTCV